MGEAARASHKGRILCAVAAAIVVSAWGGWLVFSLAIGALQTPPFGLSSDMVVADMVGSWLFAGLVSLSFVIPSVLVLNLPVAIYIMRNRVDRPTGGMLLLAVAAIQTIATPSLALPWFGAPTELISLAMPIALPFACLASLTTWWVLYRGRTV